MRRVPILCIPVARRQERGFALLVIFLIAAAVAFTMYQELPRAAFESARDKEQLCDGPRQSVQARHSGVLRRE